MAGYSLLGSVRKTGHHLVSVAALRLVKTAVRRVVRTAIRRLVRTESQRLVGAAGQRLVMAGRRLVRKTMQYQPVNSGLRLRPADIGAAQDDR